jgi:hypothetical protein
MVSQLVFNPQSMPLKVPYDELLAKVYQRELIALLKIAHGECQVRYIHFDKSLLTGFFMENYSFQQWLQHANPATERPLILSLLLNKSKPKIPDWIGLKTEKLAKDYCFDELVWGLVYFFDLVLFSFATHEKWHTELFECEYFDMTDDDEATKIAVIRHASTAEHLRQHKRIYYCHPKHCHQLPHVGVRGTRMDLSEKEAEGVLRDALKIRNKKQLYGYSKKTKSFYEFQPETPEESKPILGERNRYHGYPVQPKELKKDLSEKVFNEILQALEERGIIDTDNAKDLKQD